MTIAIIILVLILSFSLTIWGLRENYKKLPKGSRIIDLIKMTRIIWFVPGVNLVYALVALVYITIWQVPIK